VNPVKIVLALLRQIQFIIWQMAERASDKRVISIMVNQEQKKS